MKKNKMRKKKKEKKIDIAIIVFIILILAALAVILFVKNPNEEQNKDVYLVYQQECTKDEGYFEELSQVIYGFVNKSWIMWYKNQSLYCLKNEETEFTKEEFEALDLDCKCVEYGRRICPEGFELKGNVCYKGKVFTNYLKSCTKYECNKNYYVEVKWQE